MDVYRGQCTYISTTQPMHVQFSELGISLSNKFCFGYLPVSVDSRQIFQVLCSTVGGASWRKVQFLVWSETAKASATYGGAK